MDPSQNSQHQGASGYGSNNNRIDLHNFVPDYSKSNALKARLYDSGISNNPMPSVKRPIEENISTKPFSAKMNSSKIQALSPLKKKIQDLNTKIISNLNESYRDAAIREAEYLGDGTADYYRSQHIIIPQPTYLRESGVGQKLQSSMAVSVGQPRMTGQLLNRKTAQMAPLDPEYQARVNEQLNKSQSNIDPSKVMSGPPALVYAGFEGGASMSQKNLEQARCKFLLDKLTKKLQPRTLAPIEETKSQRSASDLLKGSSAAGGKPKAETEAPVVVHNLREENQNKPKKPQQWGELDKYIELLLDTRSEEETVFTYLICKNKNDPYDLEPCGYGGKEQGGGRYYTISGKGLTQYEKEQPVLFMSLGQWLIERDSYNHIKDFSFFKQFRQWKFMRLWKRMIKKQNKIKAFNLLDENLFILQENFREHLLTHRSLMLKMSQERFVDTCQSSEYKKIDEFAQAQEDRRIAVVKRIEQKSRESRENVQLLFDAVLKKLRDQIVGEITMDETNAQKNPEPKNNAVSMKKKETNSVYERLEFPAGMTYAHRSSLRKECMKFLRFAYLADALSLEALSTIYIQSVNDMITRIRELDAIPDMEAIMQMEFDDGNAGATAPRGKDPLFYTNIILDDSAALPADEIKDEPIDDFLPPPRGKSQVQDFDLLAHLEIKQIVEGEEKEEEEVEEDEDEGDQLVQKYRKITPNIQDYWIKLIPNDTEFIAVIMKTFSEGLQAIKCFERWSKHTDLLLYSEALETWDETVGDNLGENGLESTSLDPDEWISKAEIWTTSKPQVEELVKSAYGKAKLFMTRFQPLLEIYWRNKQFDINILVDVDLVNSVESLQNTLDLLKFYSQHFQTQLPGVTDIGLFHLDSQKIKSDLAPTPKQLQDEVEKLVPTITKQRTLLVLEWLNTSIREMQRHVTDVSDFVLKKIDFERIGADFQPKRDQIDLYDQIISVLKNFGFKIKKEDDNSIKDASKEILRLQTQLAEVESRLDADTEKHKKDLELKIPQLDQEVQNLIEDCQHPQFLDNQSNMPDMIKLLDQKMEKFVELRNTSIQYNGWQDEMKWTPTIFSNIEELKSELEARHTLWHSLQEWKDLKEQYEKMLWNDIKIDEISATSDHYQKIANRLLRTLPANPIVEELKELVETFKEAMPIVKACRAEELLSEHWDAINDLIPNGKIDIEREDFTLLSLIELEVNEYQDDIVAISRRAIGEAKLKVDLSKLQDLWKIQLLAVKPYKDRDQVFVLDLVDELYTFLDENLANINMIRGNQYKAVVEKDAEKLRKDLITMNQVTEDLLTLQKSWMYLENIFSSGEIKKVLQAESAAFDKIDTFFKATMVQADKQQTAQKFLNKQSKLLDQLKTNNESVDYIMKMLAQFLESKRGAFPRFCFLSDDELLEILAKQTEPDKIQGFLKQLFDGLFRLDLNETNDSTAMSSREGEVIKFKKIVKHQNKVEEWLNRVQDEMRATLTRLLKEGNTAYPADMNDKKNWVMEQPAQVVTTVDMIQWCQQTEDAINEMSSDPDSLNQWFTTNDDWLKKLTELVRGDLSDLKRAIVAALITQDVHARDIVDDLRKENCSSIYDFNWQKQLRYTYEEMEGDAELKCVIRQIQALLYYGYEYMGATTRLVITPLTDKCWITITGALHIKLGANPAGPAGTGKTESTKDLAKAMAVFCVVYNCSDQVDYMMMQKHLSGLASQGCWTCLDEFNRILVEVLSVIAQQLQEIRKALLAGVEEFDFQGSNIDLKPEFGCHITMNPGYAGRTELPDNLKVLFRPVAMMIPSYELIAQVMLYSEGFTKSDNLAKKMVKLYKLSSEQLSQQYHYDFGMRAVKSVLVMAGGLKRANPDDPEDAVLIRAMKDANVPKFLKDDLPLFAAIVQDLFPTVIIKDPDYSDFQKNIVKQLRLRQLQPHAPFMAKVIQLFETFNVRFGVMLVGYTGSGKTTCYEILEALMTAVRAENPRAPREYQKVTSQVLNPKAISMGELYGQVDLATQEWTDGLASKIMRNGAEQPPPDKPQNDKEWTVFDGPVDALWIENMNTVLDDNMTLCLANGQRIKLRPQMRMLFEVNDLRVASPATVSRCGMVYLTQEDLGWEPYVKTWLETRFTTEHPLSSENRAWLWDQFDGTINIGIEKVRSHPLVEPIKTDNLQLVRSMCNIFEILVLAPGVVFKGDEAAQRKDILSFFAFAYCFGLGSALSDKSKDYFDSTVREQFKAAQYPAPFTVFDYFYDLKAHCFKPWSEKVKEFQFQKEMPFFDIMVETEMTYKHGYMLELLLGGNKPIFFTGETGVGKSVVIQNSLNKLAEKERDGIVPIALNFSAQTNSKQTQDSIMDKLEKISRKVLGAQAGKRNAVFVDDINMPLVETYGAQPPIEFLRLLVDRQGLYERAEWEWKTVRDTTLICAAAPPLGGRSPLCTRFSTNFNMFCLPEATEGLLSFIFRNILGGFMKSWNFAEDVQALKDSIIASTIEVYIKISNTLRATPTKFHYSFNLRDVSKVVQGILMTKNVSINKPDVCVKLWVNEVSRVFMDRLIDDDDREWFVGEVMEMLSRNFKSGIEKEEIFGDNKVKFGDILKIDAGRIYEEIADGNKLTKALEGQLEDFNDASTNKMNLVFFDDAVHHILRICRSLRQPRGNIMLIGVGGSGKQSLVRLASFMYEFQFKQIEIKKDYKHKDFNEFVKELMFASGVMGKEIAFTMTDSQILMESFLEDINNVLNTGEIPNLMLGEDKDYINQELPNQIKIEGSTELIQQEFVKRVRQSFHICLCMSPVGNDLRIRCRQFPSLVNCCTLDWFSKWPPEALLFVSQQKLIDLELPSEEVREELAKMCMLIHTTVEDASTRFFDELRRKVYTTPKSYLDLISLYINTLDKKRKEYYANKNRLSDGLKKLEDTNKQIAELKVSLAESAPILAQKDIDLAETMTIVERETADANVVKAQVEKEEEIVSKQYAEANAVKAEVEDDLAAAQPEMDKAKAAVASLEAPSIVELASFNQPNPNIAMVLEPILMLLGEKKKDWKTAQQLMKKTQPFLAALKTFDVSTVKESLIQKIRKEYLSKPDFNQAAVSRLSVPAGAMCTWIIALSSYQIVYKKIVPKKAKLKEVSSTAEEAKSILDEKLAGVRAAQEKVDALNTQATKLKDEKALLEANIKRDQGRMMRAEKLVVLLKDEGIRWKETVAILEDEINKLIGDVFLSCACISYFGGFTGTYRQELTSKWTYECIERGIPAGEEFSLVKVMGDPVQISEWNMNALPSDSVSLENGILSTKAERYGLCIDPQEQANKWIKNMFKGSDLNLTTFVSKTFLRSVTNCVYNGKPLLIEDVQEQVEPSIDSILLHQEFLDEDGSWKIKLDKEEPYQFVDGFKLFMTTKMPNPHYPPEVCIKVTLINFTVTETGLQEQLLGDVVIKEKPEVEAKRQQIVIQMDSDKKTLKAIENKILQLLKENEIEQILDEDTLINTLDASKVTSSEINTRMADAVVVQKEIEETRAQYTTVSLRGSILYFVIADMANINNMYQNSLQFVKVLFNKAIDSTPKNDDLAIRLRDLIDTISKQIYSNISRGLFEADKLIFTYLISTSVNRQAGIITPAGWNTLLRGAMPLTQQQKDTQPINPMPALMTDISYTVLYSAVCQISAFDGIIPDIKENQEPWREWATCANPEEQKLPGEWEESLTDFQKCILLKVFRPEKLMFAFKNYVRTHLGKFYVEGQNTTMESIYKDTDHLTPLIFILSTGADPTEMLYKFARDKDFSDKLDTISLGQGQTEKALNLIKDSCVNGKWVLLQNCHLSQEFMPHLERAVLALPDEEEINESFRLYLTSTPVDFFPVSVLQNGVKLTTEPPRGIKANLKRSYAELTDDWLNDCKKESIYRKMVFGVAFFHAIVQERRKFGPLGWNVSYAFNDSDLNTSFTMLKIFLDEQDEVPWEALVYVTGIINYGGRVTDDQDRRCLITTLEKYYCPDNLNDDYFYSDSEIYRAPTYGDAQSYRDYIQSLPEEDAPEVFGLHDNANIAYQMQESNVMVEKVLSIQPRVGGGGGGLSPDEIVLEKSKQIKEQIPANLDRSEGLKDLFKTHNGLLPSLSTVLVQEMEKFNRLLVEMRKSLDDIVQAIGGFIVMSSELDAMYLSLTNGVVPANWAKVAYPSLKPLTSWFEDLIKRVDFMDNWLRNGNPVSFWLPGMFFPQGFLTGCLQTHARQYKIAIDELSFSFIVIDAEEPDQVEEKPQDGVLVNGLFMDGARYNRELKCIDEQLPDVLYDTMPLIHFIPSKDYVPKEEEYSCPLYKTGLRQGVLSTTGASTNYVLSVELKCNTDGDVYAPPAHWIRRASAMLCQLND